MTDTVAVQAGFLIPVVAFAVPFFITGPQWLTGTIVNMLLVLAAAKLSGTALWLVIVLPSLGALGNGMLFGKFTPFLLFFLPFIWAGNLLLVRLFQFFDAALPSPLAVIASAGAKAALLYLGAFLLFRMSWVPEVFLKSMGMVQLITAIVGGFLALALLRAL